MQRYDVYLYGMILKTNSFWCYVKKMDTINGEFLVN